MTTTTNQTPNKIETGAFAEAKSQNLVKFVIAGIIVVLIGLTAFTLVNTWTGTAAQEAAPVALDKPVDVQIPPSYASECYSNMGLLHACESGWVPAAVNFTAPASLPEECYSNMGLLHACESGMNPDMLNVSAPAGFPAECYSSLGMLHACESGYTPGQN